MNRKRTSVVWKIPKQDFCEIVSKSTTLTAIAKAIGACPAAGTFPIIKKRLLEENIDYSHIKLGLDSNKGKIISRFSVPLESVMVEHSTYSRTHLKKRLLNSGKLKNECSICGIGPVWNGKVLVMRLDHENGVSDDHREENLRLVCPNCDSQLDTYCMKNRRKKVQKQCSDCEQKVSGDSIRCRKCNHRSRIMNIPTKIKWPADEDLVRMIKDSNKNVIAKNLGISWNALSSRLKVHDIEI